MDYALLENLTPREHNVVDLWAEGKTDKEIAADLVISVHTVDSHRRNIFEKLNVNTRTRSCSYQFVQEFSKWRIFAIDFTTRDRIP